jgi:hypothetical protein
MLAKIPNVWLK